MQSNMATRVCILLPSHWSAGMGGAEYQVKCLIDRLSESNEFKIYYLAREVGENFKDERYATLKICKRGKLGKYGYFIDGPALLKKLYQIKPDVIYQRVGCAYTGIAALYAQKFNCKLIWHVARDDDVQKQVINPFRYPHHYIEYKLREFGLKKAHIIIAQTNQQVRMLQANYGVRPRKVIKNFHPVPGRCKRDKKTSKCLNILWVANFKPIKQPDLFIKLAKDVYQKIGARAKFLMIGRRADWDSKWQQQLEDQINRLPNLSYLGAKSLDEVNEIMLGADLFVNTSLFEGFPNTFIQAWMRQVPVLSLNCNPDKILTKEKIGICTGTYPRLLASVLDLIDAPQRLQQMGKRARSYALKEHSMHNADELIDIIKACL